jgi:hypothetical protein
LASAGADAELSARLRPPVGRDPGVQLGRDLCWWLTRLGLMRSRSDSIASCSTIETSTRRMVASSWTICRPEFAATDDQH